MHKINKYAGKFCNLWIFLLTHLTFLWTRSHLSAPVLYQFSGVLLQLSSDPQVRINWSLSGQIGWPGNIWFKTQSQSIFSLYVYKPTNKQQERRVTTSFVVFFYPKVFPRLVGSQSINPLQGRNWSEKAQRIPWVSVETHFHVKTGLEKIFPKRALSVVV